MGSHGADGNGGGMVKGNPGTPATGAAAAPASVPVWFELLAPNSAQCVKNKKFTMMRIKTQPLLFRGLLNAQRYV